jgi:hypothetical protein
VSLFLYRLYELYILYGTQDAVAPAPAPALALPSLDLPGRQPGWRFEVAGSRSKVGDCRLEIAGWPVVACCWLLPARGMQLGIGSACAACRQACGRVGGRRKTFHAGCRGRL